MQEESYRAWDASHVSCMILLHGRTKVKKIDYSWLSLALSPLIAQHRARNKLVIFHLCQDQPFMEKDLPLHAVLSSLISQLLDSVSEAKLSLLRDETQYQGLKRKLSDLAWGASPPKVPFAVLRQLLDLFPEVYIALDRIDRIRGDPYTFMSSLVSLIKNSVWEESFRKISREA